MKHYIFLTSGIFEMGGAEMFTANKSKYLKSKGWNVHVFYFRQLGELKIQDLAEYTNNCIPELLFGVTYFTHKRRSGIINRICRGINPNDEVIVESHIIHLAYWGELIAERCKGVSILNSMEENIAAFTPKEAAFIEYKLKRMEILNASVKSLHRYFNNYYKEEYSNYTHNYMRAFCSNVIVDEDNSLNLPHDGINIMSIGRLDKPYIIPMFEEVRHFVQANHNLKFNILIIGGSPDGKVENIIQGILGDCNNITIYMYGYVFPVPRNLIKIADVGIATANSVLVTSDEGIPTIAIDIHDLLPIGIYGRTTMNKFSREKEPPDSVSNLLRRVLIEYEFTKIPPKEIDVDAELEKVFSKQIEFLALSTKDKKYYDIDSIYPCYVCYKNILSKYVVNIIKKK